MDRLRVEYRDGDGFGFHLHRDLHARWVGALMRNDDTLSSIVMTNED